MVYRHPSTMCLVQKRYSAGSYSSSDGTLPFGYITLVQLALRRPHSDRWEGEICDDAEHLLILKTTSSALSALKARVLELHPYECPEIIAIPVTDGHSAYIDWIRQNVIASEKS